MAIDVHGANVRQLLAEGRGESGFAQHLWDSYGESVESVHALYSLIDSPVDDLIASISATVQHIYKLVD